MKRFSCFFIWIFVLTSILPAQEREVKLKIVQTSDVHGNYYPYDFIRRREATGSLARVHALVQKEREAYGENLILLDNGDILQGQPTAYYYNYIDTVAPHLAAEMMNFMGYNAGNMGNHDVETGRSVFDRWAGDCRFPILGANIVDTATGETHFKPYEVLERDGVKIVVLGMITPAIPVWLSENLWKGLRFDDMEETARKWMKIIREKENPDLVIGIFHAGQDALLMGGKYRENASLEVARNVPGFDIDLMGHDHARECKKVMNVAGDSVLIIDPASNGIVLSNVDVTLKLKDGKVQSKDVKGELTETEAYGISEDFMKRFMRSKVARDLDSEYNRMQWAGEEYLLEEFADECPQTQKGNARYDREVMYWTGYLYRYWHILTNEPSREIYAQAPAKTMNTNYLMFHTMAPELAIEDLKELHQQKKQSKKQKSRKPEQQI